MTQCLEYGGRDFANKGLLTFYGQVSVLADDAPAPIGPLSYLLAVLIAFIS